MPRGDGTGPNGFGPITGRAAGLCAGFSIPGYMNPVQGRVFGNFGRGRSGGHGRGFRHMYWVTNLPGWVRYNADPALGGAINPYFYDVQPGMTPEQESELLKNQAKLVQDKLSTLNDRIQKLEKSKEEKI